MRFIVHEQAYEQPVAAGRFRYEQENQATGALETWRLTKAIEEYEILRVDLDARPAESGHSYLYHLVRQANGRPERLSYRFWGSSLMVEGTLLFAQTHITGTRTVNGVTYEEDMDLPAGYGFWFPSTVGLGLLAGLGRGLAVTLDTVFSIQCSVFSLQAVEVDLKMGEVKEIGIGPRVVTARPLHIRWQENERTLWLDEHDWPVKMAREDGLTAVETHPFTLKNKEN